MANKIWKEVFLIMCSSSRKNARNTERFSLSLRITDDYALQTLCGEQHNVCNDEGKLAGLPLNRALRDEDGDIYSFLKLRNAAAEISEGGCVLNGSLH